eukprot:CAMPEP_0171974330 /NCGR_PEP_ID=MMETSP0993-20121228/231863_1 /TAXON_ID=483369 /ORGANISM="non described non described, Strain CCMP2098" /LENGTH=44 /DNA_ID= /DNA_START= /DNA_END= /DNA_ORIENTATION=
MSACGWRGGASGEVEIVEDEAPGSAAAAFDADDDNEIFLVVIAA